MKRHWTIEFSEKVSQGVFASDLEAWSYALKHFPGKSFLVRPIYMRQSGEGNIEQIKKIWYGDKFIYEEKE